jgi:OmcA/MtrC family decaheme c-type cytochrome
MHTHRRSAALAFAAVLAIAGCKGKDGKNGAPGAPGADLRPPMTAETCTYCHAAGAIADPTPFHDAAATAATAKGSIQILSADFTAGAGGVVKPVVTFKVFDRNNDERTDLTKFNFTATELIPATATMPQHWASYVWASATGFAGGVPSREAPATVTYDAVNARYAYTFTTDISYQTPATLGSPPAYDPAKVQRIGIQLASDATKTFDFANGVADFTPGTTAPNAALSREIVKTDACNACHGRLTIHGRRVEVQYCTTCHNPGLVEDGNLTGDLGPYVHKIHGREKLTSPTTPIMAGLIPEEITYPQRIVHCDTCHTGAEGQRWNTNPSIYACTSCHDSISFVSPPPTGLTLHTGGVATDADCTGCHGATSTGKRNIKIAHSVPAETEAKKLLPQFGTVTYDATANTLAAQFRIVDPTNANAPYALTNSYFTQAAGASSLTMLVAFKNADFTNAGQTGTTFGQPLNVNLLALPAGSTLSAQDASGYYTLTVTNALPAAAITPAVAVGGTVAIQGHPAFLVGTVVTRIPMPNASKSFTINLRTGSTTAPAARRAVVNIDKCNDCHFNLSLHGNNRTGDITTCTTCHNTEATDGSRRPNFTTPGALGADGKLEEGIDFKYMIHSIHGTDLGGAITVYGFGGSVNDFADVKFPNAPSNCLACHDAGTYQAPVAAALGTSTFAGADRASGADNLRTTKGLATCGACHRAGTMQSHMIQMGGTTDVTQAQIDAVNK